MFLLELDGSLTVERVLFVLNVSEALAEKSECSVGSSDLLIPTVSVLLTNPEKQTELFICINENNG